MEAVVETLTVVSLKMNELEAMWLKDCVGTPPSNETDLNRKIRVGFSDTLISAIRKIQKDK